MRFHSISYRSILGYLLSAICVAVLAFPNRANAATISSLIDTPSNLSFIFSGNGINDQVLTSGVLPLTNWNILQETHSQNLLGNYGFAFSQLQHLPGDPVLLILGNAGNITPFGTAITDTETIGSDTYFLTITVNANPIGNGQWGAFSGSFSAVHGVPEGGSALLMTMMGLVWIACVRKGLPRMQVSRRQVTIER